MLYRALLYPPSVLSRRDVKQKKRTMTRETAIIVNQQVKSPNGTS